MSMRSLIVFLKFIAINELHADLNTLRVQKIDRLGKMN